MPSFRISIIAVFAALCLGLLLYQAPPLEVMAWSQQPTPQKPPPGQVTPNGFVVSPPVKPADTSRLPPAPPALPFDASPQARQNAFHLPKQIGEVAEPDIPDPVLQTSMGAVSMPEPMMNFEGIYNTTGIFPPDTDGQIGPNHYVQIVNSSAYGSQIRVWDKNTGSQLFDFGMNPLWPEGDPCHTSGYGDPVVLYDQLADRWILTQFALPSFPNGPYYECFAISQGSIPSNDPNQWWRYTFLVHQTKMNDYPKIAVWPDGYYMMVHQFLSGSTFTGTGVYVFDRSAMLDGKPATFQSSDLGTNFGGMLPSNWMGSIPPPSGAPNYYMQVDNNLGSNDLLKIFEFHVDWLNPANTSFTLVKELDIPAFDNDFDCTGCSIPQPPPPPPASPQGLDELPDRLMMHLWYRNFGDHESLVLNHTVDVDGNDHAGIRWYEVRGGAVDTTLADATRYQAGTYAPDDTHHRWMGSLAMDRVGNIALGYSVSSATLYPSVRVAGRLADDQLNQLTQAERTIIAGSGSQTGSDPYGRGRWGDYSAMSVDPVDDCTFWYTQEYYATTSFNNWRTRVASFKFPNCTASPRGTLQGMVTDNSTSDPIEGAQVSATSTLSQTSSTVTPPDGTYTLQLVTGTYQVSASAYGYQPSIINGIDIISGTVTTQGFALAPAERYTVTGQVKDAQTGWPLYAKITIAGYPAEPIWSHPASGMYTITLFGEVAYTFNVQAFSPGYQALSRPVGPLDSDASEDFLLQADMNQCNAPGYEFVPALLSEDFETSFPPAGWSVVNNAVGDVVWKNCSDWGDKNFTSGAGECAGVNSDANQYVEYDTELRTPLLDVDSHNSLVLRYLANYQNYNGNDFLDLDVSVNNGLTWTTQLSWNESHGEFRTAPGEEVLLDLTGVLTGSNNLIRWHYYDPNSPDWDWYAQIDQVQIGSCAALEGGLVVGNVYDLNTSQPLNTATIEGESGNSAITALTPLDSQVNDGFFTIFSPEGSQTLTATYTNRYGADIETPTVPLNGSTWQGFHLPAGRLVYTPLGFDVTLELDEVSTRTLAITNTGTLSATFELLEMNGEPLTHGPIELPASGVPRGWRQSYQTAEKIGLSRSQPPAAPFAAGNVVRYWSASQTSPWGIAYDAISHTVWVSEGWGNNEILEYTPGGALTSRSWPYTFNPTYGPADAAFNWNTGMLWVMGVGDTSCIHEIDPQSGVTGNMVCPGFTVSPRGLAYDPASDTWFAGGWNDAMIHRFSSDGILYSSVNVGLNISGLAYNPDSGHLFVMINDTSTKVYVLDVNDNYSAVGQFTISQGFGSYAGAGLEFDCDGKLWAVDQSTNLVYQFDSGESPNLCARDIPWLDETPASGSLIESGGQNIAIAFDATVPEITQPGVYQAMLKTKHTTPYILANIPITMNVVQTMYQPELSPDTATMGYPSQQATFTIAITNTGAVPDTFDVIASGVWTATTPATIGPLAGGDSAFFEVTVAIPPGTPGGTEDIATLTAASQGNPSRSDLVYLTTRVWRRWFFPFIPN